MWSDGGELVCIASEEAFYILKFDSQAVQNAVANNEGIDEDGIEAAFDVRREREGGREREREGERGRGRERGEGERERERGKERGRALNMSY